MGFLYATKIISVLKNSVDFVKADNNLRRNFYITTTSIREPVDFYHACLLQFSERLSNYHECERLATMIIKMIVLGFMAIAHPMVLPTC